MSNLSSNRSFKFGDGLFETVRVVNSKVVFLKEHFERLNNGFDLLSFEKPTGFSSEWLEFQIINSLKGHSIANQPSWRVRITFWRESPGFFCPENNTVSFQIESIQLNHTHFVLSEKGIEIGIYNDVVITPDIISGIKSCSALPYVMAAIHKRKMNWGDALILNSKGRIAEASSSNIFMIKNRQILTPSAEEGPVLGVCRRKIIESAHEIDLEIIETLLKPEDLLHAEEIWLTNAVTGINWINSLSGYNFKFTKTYAEAMTAILNNKAML